MEMTEEFAFARRSSIARTPPPGSVRQMRAEAQVEVDTSPTETFSTPGTAGSFYWDGKDLRSEFYKLTASNIGSQPKINKAAREVETPRKKRKATESPKMDAHLLGKAAEAHFAAPAETLARMAKFLSEPAAKTINAKLKDMIRTANIQMTRAMKTAERMLASAERAQMQEASQQTSPIKEAETETTQNKDAQTTTELHTAHTDAQTSPS